jgi:hypothetical protein
MRLPMGSRSTSAFRFASILSFLSLCAFAQDDFGTFIPRSKSGTYRESDIFAAFPELRGARKLSECSNSIMSGATRLVFISDIGKNEVTVKSARCKPVDKGLSCQPVRSSTNYFLESPEHFFSLENLTFAQARPIVEAYQAGGVTGLPDWFATARPDVASITALPDGSYRMRFGDVYCTGCTAAYNVRLEASGTEARLVYVGDPEGMCF